MTISSIVFVYNADSGLLNEMKDYVHKIVSPASYGCKLCAITYGRIGIKDQWKAFIEQLGIPVRFLHRDEFVETMEISKNPSHVGISKRKRALRSLYLLRNK